MRWSMWPVSISVHVLVVITVLMVPLTAEVEWPAPAPLHRLMVATKVVPVPDAVTPILTTTRPVAVLPTVIAANTLEAPRDAPTPPVGPVVPNLAPTGTGTIDPSLLGPPGDTMPAPPTSPRQEPKPAPAVFRIGQGIREPKRIAGAPPEYPVFARSARIQGVVILEAVINERGTIERIKVLKSEPLLDAAAIAAVKDWRYTPTLLNGVPVSVLMTITINFTLQN
jgi:protein TonB